MTSPWTVNTTLEWTTGFFQRNSIPEARLEAEVLLAAVLECPRLDLYLQHDEIISGEKLKVFKEAIRERQRRKPVSYILGEKEFMGITFKVNEHTLIPRPETELLVEEAMKIIDAGHAGTVVDLCTGSGNIAVSLAKLSNVFRVYASDISIEALKLAQVNIDRHGLAAKITLKKGDLFEAFKGEYLERTVDIIISNPPYIARDEFSTLEPELSYEPRIALDGGEDGLDFYRRIARESRPFLKEGGYLVFEMSAMKSERIKRILAENGYCTVKMVKDLSGLDRIIIAR